MKRIILGMGIIVGGTALAFVLILASSAPFSSTAFADASCSLNGQTSCQSCNPACPSDPGACVSGCTTPFGCSALAGFPPCSPTHKECVNQSCATVEGAGQNACVTTTPDCLPPSPAGAVAGGAGGTGTPPPTAPGCTGFETSGPCRPDLAASANSCIPGTASTDGFGRGQCLVQTSMGNMYHNYCLPSETTGACAPSRINQYAASAAAAAAQATDKAAGINETCVATQDSFPAQGGDPTTGLNYFYTTICTPVGGGAQTVRPGGSTPPGSGATGGSTPTGTSANNPISGVVSTLENSILTYRASAAAQAQTESNIGATVSAGTAGQALLSALRTSLQNIGDALTANANTISPAALTSIKNVLGSITQIIQSLTTNGSLSGSK